MARDRAPRLALVHTPEAAPHSLQADCGSEKKEVGVYPCL